MGRWAGYMGKVAPAVAVTTTQQRHGFVAGATLQISSIYRPSPTSRHGAMVAAATSFSLPYPNRLPLIIKVALLTHHHTCRQSGMPTTCPWCLDLGTPIHRISRTAIIHHKGAWLARQQLRRTSGHGDIPDSSSNGIDDGDIQASNAENGGYDSPTSDSDDDGESPGTIEPCKPVVYLPSALLSRARPSAYGPKY